MGISGIEFRRLAMGRVSISGGNPVFTSTAQPAGTSSGTQVANLGYTAVARTGGGLANGDFSLTLARPLEESQRFYQLAVLSPAGTPLRPVIVIDATAGQATVRVQTIDSNGNGADPVSIDIAVDEYPAH